MKRWWDDTLSKRLFLLLWLTLLGSHWLGFWLAHPTRWASEGMSHPAPGPGPRGMPLPSALPPGLFPIDAEDGPGADHLSEMPLPPEPPPEPSHIAPFARMWLDLAVRVLVMGAAAWLGSLWLSRPMRRLAQAAQHLDQLDDTGGPVEVRQMAHSFNGMVKRLRSQFDERSLLMGAVSHDLRTPLTRLRMRLERLRPDPVVERCVQDIQDINTLIEAVLDALNEERSQEAVVAVDVLALAQALADDLAEAGQLVQAQGEQVNACVQPSALKRVLNNLIGNAVRYGGCASVTVFDERGQLTVHIDDQGPGIPNAMLDAVFQPFVRLDASRHRDLGGVGLGLYIARELTLRQGGSLTLSNRLEGGLRATLTLPKVAQAA